MHREDVSRRYDQLAQLATDAIPLVRRKDADVLDPISVSVHLGKSADGRHADKPAALARKREYASADKEPMQGLCRRRLTLGIDDEQQAIDILEIRSGSEYI